jgi:release factor glutamine methyltransferase
VGQLQAIHTGSNGLPRHEIERLLVAVTGRSRSDLLREVELSEAEAATFKAFVLRRLAHEPLQYIEGSVPFGTVEIDVDPRVLVPRPETEYLLELVSERAEAPEVIVDLCTGSGNLALALKAAFPHADVYATDLSPEATAVARSNALKNGLSISVLNGNLFDPLPQALRGKVDVLVANPPYLAESELADLPPDVQNEPEMALVSGPSGDELVCEIAEGLGTWVRPGGIIGIEVSEYHATAVVELFSEISGQVVKDLSGRDRFVLGRSPVE